MKLEAEIDPAAEIALIAPAATLTAEETAAKTRPNRTEMRKP